MTGPDTFPGDTARAIAFLSRLPMPDRVFVGHDGRMGRIVRAFPVAGLLITLPAALTLAIVLATGADPWLVALLALTVQTVVTGALHEDGLADSADGLGGGRSRGHALEIMKDSRVGTYGVIALILSFAVRAAALSALARICGPAGTAMVLLAVAALSRAGMVWHWSLLPSAREQGVAAGAGTPEPGAVTTALATGTVLAALLILSAGLSLVATLMAVAAFLVTVRLFSRFVRTRIAGHTGDTIGATQQVAEIAVLVTLAVLS